MNCPFLSKNHVLKTSLFLPIFIVTCYIPLIAYPSPVFAQEESQTTYNQPSTNPDVPKNLHTYTQNVMIEVMAALHCQLTGTDPVNPNQPCLGVDSQTGQIGFVQNGGGAIGVVGHMITMLYTPPLHTSDSLGYLAQNFGIAKVAHAQTKCYDGTGFCGIQPILGLWAVFRNIAYLAFVIVFIIIGLAIMLRVKIDPRTVMTIQNQIPKIIIGIIVLTFSAAIAGFFIDLMFTSTYLAINTIDSAYKSVVPTPGPRQLATEATEQIYTPPVGFVNELLGKNVENRGPFDGGVINTAIVAADGIAGIVANLFGAGQVDKTVDRVFNTNNQTPITFNPLPNVDLGGLVVGILGKLMSFFLNILFRIIFVIAILFALIQLWFILLKTYIFILLDIVLAPFYILSGLLPGGGGPGFGGWMRSMISNLVAFPAAIFMFGIGKLFMDAFSNSSPNAIFIPPLIGNPGDPSAIGALIGLGFILLTPQVVNMAKAALKAPEMKFMAAIGQAVGAGAAPMQRLTSGASNVLFGTPYKEGALKDPLATFIRALKT